MVHLKINPWNKEIPNLETIMTSGSMLNFGGVGKYARLPAPIECLRMTRAPRVSDNLVVWTQEGGLAWTREKNTQLQPMGP